MSSLKFVNIAGLLNTFNFEIEQLPDNLKCVKCKSILKDACQVPCGCRFCRICIDHLITIGGEVCQGVSEECRESLISCFTSDYRANNSISKLIVKCPHDWCADKCQLSNMEDHLGECRRKSVECPFRVLGCKQHKLDAEEMNGHLHQANHGHSEILIGMLANINREMEMLKDRNEECLTQIDMLKRRDENSKNEIEVLKQKSVDSIKEIEMLKRELVLKDDQISTITDRMFHVENENKSIALENAGLADRLRILSEKLTEETIERRESDELDSARVIGHVDMEIVTIRKLIGSNKLELAKEIKSVEDDIRLSNQGAQSIKGDMCSMKSQLQSLQTAVEMGKVDAICEWLIDVNVKNTCWYSEDTTTDYFNGALRPYKYRLASYNGVYSAGDSMVIWFLIYCGSSDKYLSWPFDGRVVISVADKDKQETRMSISRQCKIDRPPDNGYRNSDYFLFSHSDLIKVGLNLRRGVRISCEIVPNTCR